MGKKKKIKLNKEQKVWLENLQWYLEHKVCWVGDQNLRECIVDGKYAVLYMNGEPLWDCFNTIVCTDSLEGIDILLAWNIYTLAHVIELDHLDLVINVRKSYRPDWSNWRQKAEEE